MQQADERSSASFFRVRNWTSLGPFAFDREQYLAVLKHSQGLIAAQLLDGLLDLEVRARKPQRKPGYHDQQKQ